MAGSLLVRKQGLMSAPVDADLVILNPDHDDYVGLNEVGRRIWDLLEIPTSARDLCRKLGEEFDAPPDRIAADVNAFVDQLKAEGLVDIVTKPVA